MSPYFRLTAYHLEENIALIIDSNGKFEKLWQFSSHLVKKGFKIIAVGNDESFDDGNIPKAFLDAHNMILRACDRGEPICQDEKIEVKERYYQTMED